MERRQAAALTRVPNLSLDGLVVNLDTSSGKLHTDCGLGLQVELIPGET